MPLQGPKPLGPVVNRPHDDSMARMVLGVVSFGQVIFRLDSRELWKGIVSSRAERLDIPARGVC
uniref:Uncharacterized protein n=1 Tax=uncultured marine virus TaxID=186617 RepID=A0A0F7L4F7_9VIRU|nr:hypothetical protein [uncultured marine virus]